MSTREEPSADRLAALALLAEPLRRRLFLTVTSHGEPMGRDAAAEALGIPRSVAAFHLDKLAESGLLEVEYRRPPGRGGPGAGRPAKLYRAAGAEAVFSVPERHYDVAATLLARAAAAAAGSGEPVEGALRTAARAFGREVGSAVAEEGGASLEARLTTVLEGQGYEPRVEAGHVTFDNCPFSRIALEQPELVCAMNREIAAGILEAAGLPPGRARLDPAPGRCCVTIDAG